MHPLLKALDFVLSGKILLPKSLGSFLFVALQQLKRRFRKRKVLCKLPYKRAAFKNVLGTTLTLNTMCIGIKLASMIICKPSLVLFCTNRKYWCVYGYYVSYKDRHLQHCFRFCLPAFFLASFFLNSFLVIRLQS